MSGVPTSGAINDRQRLAQEDLAAITTDGQFGPLSPAYFLYQARQDVGYPESSPKLSDT
ncbi:MAG: hypothetical protein WCF51_08270 [Nitrosomonadaceae bacterium]